MLAVRGVVAETDNVIPVRVPWHLGPGKNYVVYTHVMKSVYIIGASCTPFGKHVDKSFQDLARLAYLGVLADCGLAQTGAGGSALIEQAWFGNCGMGQWGQGGIRGQVALTPLVEEGLFPERVPVINVEGGCATAAFAFHGAWKDVLSGECEVSLALGVEKLISPDRPERVPEIFATGIDQLDRDKWLAYYAAAGAQAGKPFETGPGRTVYMDTYAMQADDGPAGFALARHGRRRSGRT